MLTKDDLFLQPIVDFFSKPNLAKIENDFIRSFYDETSQTHHGFITDNGVHDNEGFTSFKEVYIEKFKAEIENARITVTAIMAGSPKDKVKLTNYIQNSLKSFLTNNSEVLKSIPEIKSEIDDFKKYLFRQFSIKLALRTERFQPTSIFGYKKGFSITTLKRLYVFSVNAEIFDEDEVNVEIFIEVLTSESTNAILQFNCQTPTMVGYLLLISRFFRRLDKKHIIASNRFYTKGGIVLTPQNFDTAKNRLKKDLNSQNVLQLISQFVDKQFITSK